MGNDAGVKLVKPTLAQNLDYCEPGLRNLPQIAYTLDQWADGWIPQEVKTIVTGVGGLIYNPADFKIYNVHYQDCDDPWVFGYHKDTEISIDSIASQFGKLPIQMRQWVRHVITVPADNGWAFEWNGSVTFIRPVDDMVSVIIHETGHSLDLNGAYADKPLSSSDNWWNNYNQDEMVPDGYASTNATEDVAQNTVLAVFNENVEGGFGSIEPNWQKVFHQYATIITEAQNAGQGNSLIKPGENVAATHRLPSSAPVPMTDASPSGPAPAVRIRSRVKLVDTSHRAENPGSGCTITW